MRRLDVYVMKEMAVPLLIGTVAIVLMFQANDYMALAKALELQNVPFVAVLQVLIYRTPFYLSMTLPLGMALASSLTMARITRESELTAIRSAGVPVLRVLWPVALFGLIASAILFVNVEYIMPGSTRKATDIQVKMWGLGLAPSFAANKMITLGRLAVSFGTVERRGESGDLHLTDVMLIERPSPGQIWLVTSKDAEYYSGIWTFRNAYGHEIEGEDVLIAHSVGNLIVNEPIVVEDLFRSPAPEESTIEQLRDQINTIKKTGGNPHRQEIDLQSKFAIPMSCFIFAFVSPIFSILFARSGAFVGVLLSFVMALAYYNVFIVSTQIFSKINSIPPIAAAWLPNLIFLVLGIFAIRRIE